MLSRISSPPTSTVWLSQGSFLLSLLLSFLWQPRVTQGQYRNDTTIYQETMSANTLSLIEQIESNPDTNLLFFPDRKYAYNNYYIFDYPTSSEYVVGLIVDPCRSNPYDCCMNVFGSPEYPALLNSGLQPERVFQYIVIASDTEVAKNYYLVNEYGSSIATTAQRTPDDYQIWNDTCIALNNPFDYCAGRNYAYQRSPVRPACEDNNASVNVLAGCYAPNGTYNSQCVAVAYTSNAFVPLCGVNEANHCGTYLEVHMPHGTPYQDETAIIAEVQIDQRNVSGYYTTVLPTTWMHNSSRVLCAYTESFFRVGSLVYIKSSAPVCCCPPPFDSGTRIGSFQCPKGATANGAFGYTSQSLADTLTLESLMLLYPYCPIDINANTDIFMCSVYDHDAQRSYTRACQNVTQTNPSIARSYTSGDMLGMYDNVCPYYPSCALTLQSGKCQYTDDRFTFIGQVGIVTKVDNEARIPQVWVSFNNNRTSYQFSQEDVVLETYKSQYEIWWVVRSKSNLTVRKRKGFNVTSPPCTFDTTNNRYFNRF